MKKYNKRYDKLDRYYRKQKIVGAAMILLAVLTTLILGDATVALFLVPIAILVICTKDLVLYDEDIDELRRLKENRWKER